MLVYACVGDCTSDFANPKMIEIRRHDDSGLETVEVKITMSASCTCPTWRCIKHKAGHKEEGMTKDPNVKEEIIKGKANLDRRIEELTKEGGHDFTHSEIETDTFKLMYIIGVYVDKDGNEVID